jgi:CO dehydrogenase/acetyl-CoA synthase gamma subunit (corrinoid Fe-S protein)
MIAADLYLNTIDLLKYLPGTDCRQCGEPTCAAFVRQLKSRISSATDCPFVSDRQVKAFGLALRARAILPEIPALELPRPGGTGLMEINQPYGRSPVLITGNSQFTQEVLTSIMAYTLSPFWLLFVDCRGDTVDMAMIYQSLTVEKISRFLEDAPMGQEQKGHEVILPGFASGLREQLERQTGWQVRTGPICIAELPLFLGEQWQMPDDCSL